jgi:glycogen debranching enzyme
MPELFCGFERQADEAPVPYSLACAPQAWAAGAAFLLLKASLGAHVDAINRRVIVRNPRLPSWIDELSISGLDCGGVGVDLMFVRQKDGVAISLDRNDGSVTLVRP